MENLVLNIVGIIAALLFLFYTIYQIKRGKLLLRYSLLWMVLSILVLVIAIFPIPVFRLGNLLGFSVSSNFIFSIAIFFIMVFCMTLTRAISQQVVKNKKAVQRIALLEYRLDKLDNSK